mgnify:CR=1 FL=1
MSAHLTDQQIQDLLQKRMDPDGQLACMEHMGVCEDCMLRYADRVEAAYSIDPPRGMAEEILSHSRGMVRQDTQPDAAHWETARQNMAVQDTQPDAAHWETARQNMAVQDTQPDVEHWETARQNMAVQDTQPDAAHWETARQNMAVRDTQPDAAQQGAVRQTMARRVTVRYVIALAASLAIAVSLWFGGVFTQVRDIDKVAMQYTGEIRQTIDQQREKKEMERYYKFVNGEDMKDAKK